MPPTVLIQTAKVLDYGGSQIIFSHFPINLFYSYAHEDEELRAGLENHLTLLEREGLINVWHDRKIGAGSDWSGEIDRRLDAADIILILVSADFLSSDYCYDVEFTRAIEKHIAGEACVIPIILRPCDWTSSPLGKLQALPKEAKPISLWADRDEALLNVAKGIRRLIQQSIQDGERTLPQVATHSIEILDDQRQPHQVLSNDATGVDTGIVPSQQVKEAEIFDVESIQTIETISRTEHSVIDTCIFEGKLHVLKKTERNFCQLEALKKLIGKQYDEYGLGVSIGIATPLLVGATKEYVWELHPFYEGITLQDLIRKNKYGIRGGFLGDFHEALFTVISQLHVDGLLHRDISPSNILLTGQGRFMLIDCSFCCKERSVQVPVGNSFYTAPEQREEHASFLSDWYSIAATIYFLANRYPPDYRDEQRFKSGLNNIYFGHYKASGSFIPRGKGFTGLEGSISRLYASLLDPEISNRPSDIWEVLLDEITVATEFSQLLGIFDIGKFGYLVTQKYASTFIPRNEIKPFLQKAIMFGAAKDATVKEHVESILKT